MNSMTRIPISEIQRVVGQYYGLTKSELMGKDRRWTISRPRMIAMSLSRELTPCSLPSIGRQFGKRDHTTVLSAIRRISELCAANPPLADDIETLRDKLRSIASLIARFGPEGLALAHDAAQAEWDQRRAHSLSWRNEKSDEADPARLEILWDRHPEIIWDRSAAKASAKIAAKDGPLARLMDRTEP